MSYKFPVEKLDIPKFGEEHYVGNIKLVTLDGDEKAIVDTAEKLNEVIDQINNIYEHLHRL